MSHKVTSSTEFKNADVVCRAFENLGWKIEKKAIVRGIAGTYDLVAKNPVESYGYDIGLRVTSEGVKFDHESMLYLNQTALGASFGLLKQEYAKLMIIDEVESRLGTCAAETLANGTVRLEIEIEVNA